MPDCCRDHHALRKPPEEVGGIQLFEGRFGALERQLGQPLATKRALADDGEQLAVAGPLDFKARPRASIDRGVDPEIAVGVVELEEQLGDGKLPVARPLTGGECRGETPQREWDGEEPEQMLVRAISPERALKEAHYALEIGELDYQILGLVRADKADALV